MSIPIHVKPDLCASIGKDAAFARKVSPVTVVRTAKERHSWTHKIVSGGSSLVFPYTHAPIQPPTPKANDNHNCDK